MIMSMDELINTFKSIFSLLWSSKMLGMPILFWFVIIALFGIIGSFLKGSKNGEK